MFSNTSRYASVGDAVYKDSSGRYVSYKLLRLIPTAPTLLVHNVLQQDRLDLLANTFYSDAEQFWRICDGNLAMRPEDLLRIGARLKIPLVQR
jgi:hypothetical protein